MHKELLSFKHIVKVFNGKAVINDFNLTISEGEFFGFVGKSGAGKTTLLRLLLGFYKPDQGSIYYAEKDITKKLEELRLHVGFCTQDNSFYPDLTIQENLMYYGQLYDIPGRKLAERIKELLSLVQLTGNEASFAGKISGGMKRRLDFAISMLHNPSILILDEPTTGLDPIIRRQVWDLMTKVNKAGKTIIITSHLLEFIEKHCECVGVLNHGRMLMTDTPKNLRKLYPKEPTFTDVFERIILSDHGGNP